MSAFTVKKEKTKVTIKIPRPLYDHLTQIIEGSGFHSVTEFVVYVLRDLLASRSADRGTSLSKGEMDRVRKRLRSLGYL